MAAGERQLFTNNATTALAQTAVAASTTLEVETGTGDLFASPGVGEFQLVTLESTAGAHEVVKMTGRSGDTLTAVRGYEFTAQNWTSGATVSARITATTMVGFQNQMDRILVGADGEILVGADFNVLWS